jgi:hypothetical protein
MPIAIRAKCRTLAALLQHLPLVSALVVMAGLDPAIHENTESCNQAMIMLLKFEMARK